MPIRCDRRVTCAFAAVVMSVLPSTGAFAQSAGAAVALDLKRFSGEPGTGVLDTDTPAVTFSGGASITPKVGVEFEIGIDRTATVTRTTDVRQGRLRTDYDNQMWTVSVLGALHSVVRQRVRASVLGGLTFVSFRRSVRQNQAAPVIGTRAAAGVGVRRSGGRRDGGWRSRIRPFAACLDRSGREASHLQARVRSVRLQHQALRGSQVVVLRPV